MLNLGSRLQEYLTLALSVGVMFVSAIKLTTCRALRALVPVIALALSLTSPLSMARDADVRAPAAATPQSELPQVVLKKTYQTVPAKPTVIGESPTSSSIPLSVAWSADGKKLAALSDYGANLEVWDIAADGHQIFQINSRFTNNALAFLSDEEVLTPSSGKPTPDGPIWGLSIWNPHDGSFVKGIPSQYPDRNDWWYNTISLSPDGSMVAAFAPGVSGEQKLGTTEFGENPIPIYSTKTWKILHLIPVVAPDSAAFSPDGKQIAFGDYKGLLTVYDTATGQLIKTIHPFEDGLLPSITTLVYSPDGKFLALGSTLYTNQKNTNPVRIVQIADGKVVAKYTEDMSIWKVVWSSNGKYIAFAPHDKTIRLWNPNDSDNPGVIVRGVDSMCLAFSPDGNRLASCDHDGIKVFDLHA